MKQPRRGGAASASVEGADGAGAPGAAASPEGSPATPRKRARRPAATTTAADGAPGSPAPRRSPRARKATPVAALAAADAAKAAPPPAAEGAAGPAAGAGAAPKAAAKRAPKPKLFPGPLYDPATMRPPRCEGPGLSVMSWNVAGLRSLLKKDAEAIKRLVEQERVDVLCLQETKLQDGHVADVTHALQLDGWSAAFNCSQAKKGYSGVATLCRTAPVSSTCGIGMSTHDDEGRVVTVELRDCFVVNAYVPNSGEGLRRLDYRINEWDVAFSDYVKGLEAHGKPVIVTGDLNCAHHEIDIHSPKTNLKSAGFTPEERGSFSARLVAPGGPLVDSFRAAHPGVVGYTYFSYRFNARAKHAGWRLDYCLVSRSLAARVHDSYILPAVEGSDHVPLGVVITKA